MNPSLERDEELGAALTRLEVPEHSETFEQNLTERLLAQSVRAHQVESGRSRPRHLIWLVSAAAILTLIAAIGLTVIGPGRKGPAIASAAEIRARVQNEWASIDNLSGVLITRSTGEGAEPAGEHRWRFTLNAEGDFRLIGIDRPSDLAYRSADDVERSLNVSESLGDSVTLFGSVHHGLAPGRPDRGPSTVILDRYVGSAIRALASSEGGEVTEVIHQGRPAWRLDTDIRVNRIVPEASPNHLVVTVDQEIGLPVLVVAQRGNVTIRETRIEELELNSELDPQTFEVDMNGADEVFRQDHGFRRIDLDEAEDILGYVPPQPLSIPAGYRLSKVAASNAPSPTGVEASNPPASDVISLSYRRGLDQMLVTARPIGADREAWHDPLATGEGFVDDPQILVPQAGVLAGRQVERLIDPLSVPHIWGMTHSLVITVSGDLSPAELLEVTESLEFQGE